VAQPRAVLAAVIALGAAACGSHHSPTEADRHRSLPGRLTVEAVEVLRAESFPPMVTLRVTGRVPDVCTHVDRPQVARDGRTFAVTIGTSRPPVACILLVPPPVDVSVPLGPLDPGDYRAVVNGLAVGFRI
jgi:inhibitor of cysteine peptidase